MDTSEEADFTAFVTARGHLLLRTAYALTGDRHAAEDLVQAVLAKAFARWRRIAEPEPYVQKMIYNEFVTGWRRHRRRAEISVAEPPEAATPDSMESGVASRLVLRKALLSLPPRQRAVLILRYFEDLSVDETAAVLSCGRGTVGSQTHRALIRLRELVPALDWTPDPVERRS